MSKFEGQNQTEVDALLFRNKRRTNLFKVNAPTNSEHQLSPFQQQHTAIMTEIVQRIDRQKPTVQPNPNTPIEKLLHVMKLELDIKGKPDMYAQIKKDMFVRAQSLVPQGFTLLEWLERNHFGQNPVLKSAEPTFTIHNNPSNTGIIAAVYNYDSGLFFRANIPDISKYKQATLDVCLLDQVPHVSQAAFPVTALNLVNMCLEDIKPD